MRANDECIKFNFYDSSSQTPAYDSFSSVTAAAYRQ